MCVFFFFKSPSEFQDEASGEEAFQIGSRWQESNAPMFLLNQSDVGKTGGFGDLSILVHDLDHLPREQKQVKKKQNCFITFSLFFFFFFSCVCVCVCSCQRVC